MEVGTECWIRDDAAPSGWKPGIIKSKQAVKSDSKKMVLTVVSADAPRSAGGKILSPTRRSSPMNKGKSPRGGNFTNGVPPFKHKITVDTREDSDLIKVREAAMAVGLTTNGETTTSRTGYLTQQLTPLSAPRSARHSSSLATSPPS